MKNKDVEINLGATTHEGKSENWRNTTTVTGLKILAFFATLISSCFQRVTTFQHGRKSKAHILHYWLQACCVTVMWLLYSKPRRKSVRNILRNVASSMKPLLLLHVLNICGHCLDLDTYKGRIAGGSMIYQISLSVAPAAMLSASWTFQSKPIPTRRSVYTILYSCLMIIAVCSNTAIYLTFQEGLSGILLASLLGSFFVFAENNISKWSLPEIFISLNTITAITLPFIALIFGELPYIWEELTEMKSIYNLVYGTSVMGLFNQLHLIACLWQISLSGPLTCILTRNISWIIRTVFIGIINSNMDITISSFRAMWIALIGFIVYGIDRRS